MNAPDRLGFGCVSLAGLASPRQARNLLEGVFELGIRHFDTAPIYGRGYSERLVGDFLRDKRQHVSIATKFGLSLRRAPRPPVGLAMRLNTLRGVLCGASRAPRAAAGNPPVHVSPLHPPRRIERAEVEASFEASRRALNIDTIDLYLLHESTPGCPRASSPGLPFRAQGAG